METVHNFVVLRLLHKVELLHVESCFFEVVEPEFVASRQVGECSLVKTCTLLKVVDWFSHDGIPPGSEIIDVCHSSRLHRKSQSDTRIVTYQFMFLLLVWSNEHLLLETLLDLQLSAVVSIFLLLSCSFNFH